MKVIFPKRRAFLVWSQISLQVMLPLALSQQANASTDRAQARAGVIDSGSKLVHGYRLQSGETTASLLKNNKLQIDQVWDINSFAFNSRNALLAAPVGTLIYLPGPATGAVPASSDNTANLAAKHLTAAGSQFDGRNPISADKVATGYASSLASQAAGQQAESWLNKLGGSSRITLGTGLGSSTSEIAGDVLVPLYDNKAENLFFTQLGLRRIDSRQTLNLGLGTRYFADAWMLGSNVFLDNDMTGKNRRWGIGAEWWTDNLRLSANGYLRLTEWHQSRDGTDLEERPANGWDIEAQSWIPAYPQIGGKLKYEQYYGQNVALINHSEVQSDPSAVSASVNWTPIPLVTLEGEHRSITSGKADNIVRLMLNYDFSRSLAAMLDPSQVAAMRSLQGGRYDLVSRNNRIVLDYRKQTLIKLSMARSLEGKAGQVIPLEIEVSSTHGFEKMRIVADELVKAGGTIINPLAKDAAVQLPAYNSATNNTYLLTATAIDTRGGESNPMQAKIVVHEEADIGNSSAVMAESILPANGTSATKITLMLADKDKNPVKGVADKLQLKIKSTTRAGELVTFTKFTESSTAGTYTADVTAGSTAGEVVLVSSLGGATLFETPLTLQAVVVEANNVVQLDANAIGTLVGMNIQLTATVHDKNGKAVENATVSFGGTGLDGAGEKTTDANGQAVAQMTSQTAGKFTATAQVGSGTVLSKELRFTEAGAAVAVVDLTTDLTLVEVEQPIVASVTVRDANGSPLKDEVVDFTGNELDITDVTRTDIDGIATATITSQKVGDFILRAKSGNKSSKNKTLTFTAATVAEAASIEFTSDKENYKVGDNITLTAIVKDKTGKVIKNKEVTVRYSIPVISLDKKTVLTNSQGRAIFTGQVIMSSSAAVLTATAGRVETLLGISTSD
ncbi:inverse autotransporter beta domain-containing protein [Rouxiella badensis]|uniref:inverse autotransporter beta domain-containing protein n=1 Tax=Rouxiella badensis TaxID=1646377 RepID=UPI0022AAA7DB|nr:inverse autotransporter beta domain-containing protein [Rouxiella badensis]WAT09577.1 inverse autotransporter beta domain-containing protein [Rouxiella badensis]